MDVTRERIGRIFELREMLLRLCRESIAVKGSLSFMHGIGLNFSPSSHLSLNREGRWGTTGDFATSFFHLFPALHCPLGLGELQTCPFPDVVFPILLLSALSSSPFHCALQDGFG